MATYMGTKLLSEKTGVREATIRMMANDNLLPTIREGGRYIFVEAAVEILLKLKKNAEPAMQRALDGPP